MSTRTRILWSLIVALGVLGMLAVAAVALPDVRLDDQIMGATVVLALHVALGLGAWGAGLPIRRRRLRHAPLALAMASLLWWEAFLFLEPGLGWQTTETLASVGGAISTAAIVVAHAGLLHLAPLVGFPARLIRMGAIASACALGVLFLGSIIFDDLFFFTAMESIVAVLFIAAALGTLLVPLLSLAERSGRSDEQERDVADHAPVRVRCPRCEADAEILANRPGRCAACGLKLRIEVEEPRCACGYLLYRIAAGNCPECGAAIEPSNIWGAHAADR